MTSSVSNPLFKYTIDSPLLQELFPLGHVLKDVHWETHDGRTRLPVHLSEEHTGDSVHGRLVFRLVVKLVVSNPHWRPYHIPLESTSTS